MRNAQVQYELVTEIKDVIQRTHNVKSFRVDDKGGRPFKAGQFMSVSLGEGKELKRWLSISSSPTEKDYIEFTKKLTNSQFSERLNGLKPGDKVTIKYPYGNFILDERHKKVGFLSGGIGITPIRSICKYVCDTRSDTDIVLLYGNHSFRDVAFREDLDRMQKGNPNIRVVHVICEPGEGLVCKTGHITKGVIQEDIPDLAERIFYICGPPGMVTGMKKILLEELTLPQGNIRTENFVGY